MAEDDEDDSMPIVEIIAEPTAPTPRVSHRQTTPHLSVDWMLGFDEGRQRGTVEILDALEGALTSVGVAEDVAKAIVARVRARAEKL